MHPPAAPAADSVAGLERLVLAPENFRVAENEFGEPVVLGSGAFGLVYDGWVRDGRGWLPAAHKVQLDVPGALDEIALVVGLVHPNIVRTYGFYRDRRRFPPDGAVENVVVIVMERLDPRTLFHMLEDPATPLPMARRATIAANVAAGVEYLHAAGLAHGDLKPQNVLATLDGEVFKVSDFGLVRVLQDSPGRSGGGGSKRRLRFARSSASSAEASGSGGSDTSVGTANLWGTPEFMAPELFPLDGLRAASRSLVSDVYALGVLVWCLYSRCMPFAGLPAGSLGAGPGDDLETYLRKLCPLVQRGVRPDMRCLEPGTPPAVSEWVQLCWAPRPADRPPAGALRSAFAAGRVASVPLALRSRGGSSRRVASPPPRLGDLPSSVSPRSARGEAPAASPAAGGAHRPQSPSAVAPARPLPKSASFVDKTTTPRSARTAVGSAVALPLSHTPSGGRPLSPASGGDSARHFVSPASSPKGLFPPPLLSPRSHASGLSTAAVSARLPAPPPSARTDQQQLRAPAAQAAARAPSAYAAGAAPTAVATSPRSASAVSPPPPQPGSARSPRYSPEPYPQQQYPQQQHQQRPLSPRPLISPRALSPKPAAAAVAVSTRFVAAPDARQRRTTPPTPTATGSSAHEDSQRSTPSTQSSASAGDALLATPSLSDPRHGAATPSTTGGSSVRSDVRRKTPPGIARVASTGRIALPQPLPAAGGGALMLQPLLWQPGAPPGQVAPLWRALDAQSIARPQTTAATASSVSVASTTSAHHHLAWAPAPPSPQALSPRNRANLAKMSARLDTSAVSSTAAAPSAPGLATARSQRALSPAPSAALPSARLQQLTGAAVGGGARGAGGRRVPWGGRAPSMRVMASYDSEEADHPTLVALGVERL